LENLKSAIQSILIVRIAPSLLLSLTQRQSIKEASEFIAFPQIHAPLAWRRNLAK
jgi:hypothetical protein